VHDPTASRLFPRAGTPRSRSETHSYTRLSGNPRPHTGAAYTSADTCRTPPGFPYFFSYLADPVRVEGPLTQAFCLVRGPFVEPPVGIEPTTFSLRVRRSAD
jgi:hypothetical protein